MKHIGRFLRVLLFNQKEVKYCLAHYKSDQSIRGTWFVRNIVGPLILILLPLLGLFINKERHLSEILFNGGISILAINVIAMMATYLRILEDARSSDAYSGDPGIIKREIAVIQSGLLDRSGYFIAVCTILYFIQAVFPFPYFGFWISALFVTILLTVSYFSIILGYVMFTLRNDDENFNRIYDLLIQERESETQRLQRETSVEGFNKSLLDE